MDKNGKYWGFYGAERSDQSQYNKGAGKEIILLRYTNTTTPTAHDSVCDIVHQSKLFSTSPYVHN